MIEVEHLTKQYGEHTAVSDLSFRVDSGRIYGFLGPNGAGKSTTMNIMTGCLSATEGTVRIDGYDIFDSPNEAKRRIGYLPEQPPLYLNESPLEYLRFVGEAKGLRGAELERQISAVVEQTKIGEVRRKRISALSKGYRQRVGIAQALLGNPEVIILDEPTVGLDPLQIIEIRTLVKELGQSHTVIFSSHILSEVQNLCDQILIISRGKLVAFDRPENLEKRLLGSNEITVVTDVPPAEERADGLTALRLKTDCTELHQVSREIFFAFAGAGKALLELSLKKASLEDVFLELTEHQEPPAAAPDGTEQPEHQAETEPAEATESAETAEGKGEEEP